MGNTFEHIGDIQPPWELSGPGLGSVPLDKLMFIPPGAAIELESTENLFIENNTFISCLNGILTSFPDAIGNYGNLTMRNNVLVGTYYAEWVEHGRKKYWPGIGIGVGTAAYRPDEIEERWKVYNSKAYIEIYGNRVENFTYALVIDIRNQTLKKASVENNTFTGYLELIVPRYVSMEGNKLAPLLPDLKVSNLTVEVVNDTATITAWILLDSPAPLKKSITIEIAIDGEKVVRKLYLSEPKLYVVKHVAKLSSGKHTVHVLVDPTNELEEKDEDNNYAQETVEIREPSEKTQPEESVEKETKPEEEVQVHLVVLAAAVVIVILMVVLLLYALRKTEW